MVDVESMLFTWLSDNQKTGIRKKENWKRSNCMVDDLSMYR